MLLLSPTALMPRYGLFLLALAPVFCVGLMEDMGRKVSPTIRLLVMLISSQFIISMLGVHIMRDEALGLTGYLSRPEFGIPMTLLLTAGMTNAINMTDGMHGLAGIAALFGCLGLAQISDISGNPELTRVCWILAGALVGFLLLNYPLGKIFLGDSGSYTVGFVLGWLAVSLLYRAESASIWAVGLVLFWPIADILLTILRRLGTRRHAMSADRLHIHQLIRRCLIIASSSPYIRRNANPIVTAIILPAMLITTMLGVWLWNRPREALFTFFSAFVLYVLAYWAILWLAKRLRRSRVLATKKPRSPPYQSVGKS
jgi:UDP-N-acetylmuramyl pentapeptide phosphotransferase/UDP-N-acetylglucosamine-1-phosphate transferase